MTTKNTVRETGKVFAILTSLFAGFLPAAEIDLESAIALLKAKDIPRFVSTVVKDKSLPAPFVRSDKMVGTRVNQDVKGHILGQEIIVALQSRENLSVDNPETRIWEMLDIRDWCLQKTAYGNLLIAYAAESAATKLLFRSLAATNCNIAVIEAQVDRLRTGSPSAAYWLEVLNTEDIPNLLSAEDLKKDDHGRKACLFGKLTDKTIAVDVVPDLPSGDLTSCYQRRSFPQVAFIAAVQDQEIAALQACIEVKKKRGDLPADETAFKVAIKQSASNILRDKSRLAGPLTSGQIWRLWKQYAAVCGPDKP